MRRCRWTKSAETYSCTTFSANGSFCADWSVASASHAFETTRSASTCTALSASGSFCAAWTTRTTTQPRCLAVDGGDAPICCSPENAGAYDCCERECDASVYSDAPATTRAETCRCDEAAPHGRFCQRWRCEGAAPDSRSDFFCTSASGRTANLSARQANLDVGDWCVAWRRSRDERLSFAVAACRCTGPEDDQCRSWACDEKGGDYVWPNWLWLLLPLVLAAAPLLLVTGQLLRGRPLSLLATSSCAPKGGSSSRSYRHCGALLLGVGVVSWLCPLSLVAASRGGLVVVFVVTLPTLAAMAAALLVARCRNRRLRRFAECRADAAADDDSVATASCHDADSDSDADDVDVDLDAGAGGARAGADTDPNRPPQGALAA